MSKQSNPYSLRIKNDLMDKIRFIANENDRSINGQIENILKKYVSQYEKEHGEIPISGE